VLKTAGHVKGKREGREPPIITLFLLDREPMFYYMFIAFTISGARVSVIHPDRISSRQ
jgi:hypothetical protein